MADGGAKPSYLRAAFANLYNLTLLGGLATASAVTGDWWLFGVGLAAEGLWLLFAPDDKRFRRAVDARHAQERKLEELKRLTEQTALLPANERARVQRLGAKAAEVKGEVQRNPRLGGDFMADQLRRIEELVAEFAHLAVTTWRAEEYLARSDAKAINRQREEHRKLESSAADEAARDIARQNREILEKRLAIIDELGRFGQRARGQMSLIENTIALLRDQVMTMATPEALSTQLDTVVASVEAIRDATREAEALVSSSPLAEADRGLAEALREAGAPAAVEGTGSAKSRTQVR